MRRWQRPGLASTPETTLSLALTNRAYESKSVLTVGSSLEYRQVRTMDFEGHFNPKEWLVVDRFEDPPISDNMPWSCWIDSSQLRRPKVSVHITERLIDSTMDPDKGWFFTLGYNELATYSEITYPEYLDLGLIVQPAMFNELLNADLSQVTITTSLWLSDQFASFMEWDEFSGRVVGWDVSKGKAIRLNKYSVSIRSRRADLE